MRCIDVHEAGMKFPCTIFDAPCYLLLVAIWITQLLVLHLLLFSLLRLLLPLLLPFHFSITRIAI